MLALLSAILMVAPATAHAQIHNAKREIRVSREQRELRYIVNGKVVLEAPVAVGSMEPFDYHGEHYDFQTPRGRRRVIAKKVNPRWVVPEWHYYQVAQEHGYKLVRLVDGERFTLGDGTQLVIRDGQVGRINLFGNFAAIEPGIEIIFDHTVFVPPLNTPQRSVPNALGPYALDLGDGYLIHGTHLYNENSIGGAVSHGCVRMHNADITRLFDMVPVGTPVYIDQ